MKNDQKYIPFPLFLVSGLPDDLLEIFKYGISKFSKTIKYNRLEVVLTQVLYAFYRQELPGSIKAKINILIKKKLFIPDEDYNGFSEKEFYPESGIEELTDACQKDAIFLESCIQFWQIRQAMSVLKITGSIEDIMTSAARIQKLVDERAIEHKNDVTVMISVPMMFDYYKHSKSGYEIDLLRGFLAIKSILGNKKLVGTTKEFILMRMTGAKNRTLLEGLLRLPHIHEVHTIYSKRYHMDKLLNELLARGFIKSKLGFNRRIYFSTHLNIQELPTAIHALLLKNNSKIKRDANEAAERIARFELKILIKSSLTTP